uniref:Uncharacterized protein n=1 Tax=Arundo donax TaxID=35708 RepID=A0A0A9DW57_ARUDO
MSSGLFMLLKKLELVLLSRMVDLLDQKVDHQQQPHHRPGRRCTGFQLIILSPPELLVVAHVTLLH